jgi:hypothetical protein
MAIGLKRNESGRRRSEQFARLGLAALSLAAGALAGAAALGVGAQPHHLAAALACGFAGIAGIGKRAAP